MKNLSKNVVKGWLTLWGIILIIFAILPIILCAIFANNQTNTIILGAVLLGCMLIWLAFIPLVYKNYLYLINDEKIQTTKGVIFKFNDIVPIIRVQHVELNQGPIERMFKICSINVYTAGSQHKINGIDISEGQIIIEEIKDLINKKVAEEDNE